MKKFKKIIALVLCSVFVLSLTGCGGEEPEPELTEEQKLEMQLTNLVASPYIEAIRQSNIVSPYAIINSFNKDLDESKNVFNNVSLAVEIKGEDIMNGRLYMEGADINGYYCLFTEGFPDETTDAKKTNFIISIDKQDEYLINYGIDRTVQQEVTDAEGNVGVMDVFKPKIIQKFFLIGKINKIVGDQITGEEKVNIVMLDARLVPATTYQELPVAQAESVAHEDILDSNSGESIAQTTYTYHFGKFDYDEDGFCDDLVVQIDEYLPISTLGKLLESNILTKIKTPITSYVQSLYGSDDKLGTFNINFPLTLNSLTAGECTAFDGSYVNYLKASVYGVYANQEIIQSATNNDKIAFRKILEKNFPGIIDNPFILESKDLFYSVDENGVRDLNIQLLNGETETASTPQKLWLKDTATSMSGNLTGNNYIYTEYPFKMVYQPSLYFYSDGFVKEFEAKSYVFYDIDTYLTDFRLDTINSTKSYNFVSNKNTYVATEKVILESYETTSAMGALVETGVGKYYAIDNSGEKYLATTNIFFTGNQKFAFCGISKDEKDDELYWMEVLSENGNRGYIPVKMTGEWTNPNTQYEFYDAVNDKEYSLFSDSTEYSSMFTRLD